MVASKVALGVANDIHVAATRMIRSGLECASHGDLHVARPLKSKTRMFLSRFMSAQGATS
jgi:hypothetical protein